jgi:signal peptidase I
VRRKIGQSRHSVSHSEAGPPQASGTTQVQQGAASGGRKRLRFGTPAVIALGLVVMVLVPAFVARVYTIPSGSMEQTLHGCPGCDNDRILVDKIVYRFASPVPGDVVVFSRPSTWTSAEFHGSPSANPLVRGLQLISSHIGLGAPGVTEYVKRVIAVGGQTVACCDERNRVTVDGVGVDEPYIYFLPEAGPAEQAAFGPVRVPDGHLWVMGDSRNDSLDSRAPGNGPVPVENVIGKARLILLPFDRTGSIDDPAG